MFSELQYRLPVHHEDVQEELQAVRASMEDSLLSLSSSSSTTDQCNNVRRQLMQYFKLIHQKSDDGTIFVWKKNHGGGDRTRKGDIFLERTNVCFNIGMSYILNDTNDDDDDSLEYHQRRSQDFVHAASIFEYLQHSDDDTNTIQDICLAEAQRHLYFQYSLDDHPHPLLAQMASATTFLYSDIQYDVCRCWSMYMNALSEFHQAMVHGQNTSETHLELSRLEGALKFGGFARDFGADLPDSGPIMKLLPAFLKTVSARFKELYDDTINIPDHDELPEIPAQVMVQTDPDSVLTLLLPPHISRKMMQQVQAYQQRAAAKTTVARNVLKQHQLPHALSIHTIDSVWERIQAHQNKNASSNRSDHTKQATVRDITELARTVQEYHEKIALQVKRIPDPEIQQPFATLLQHYHDLILAAGDSDTLLLEKAAHMDVHAQFRLLKLSKTQLERMFGTVGDRLRLLLTQLSDLFREREELLSQFVSEVEGGTMRMEAAQSLCQELDSNFGSQEDLLEAIVSEQNKTPQFQDILNEVELFAKHVQEGVCFYQTVLPKLEKLHQQLKEVHLRLDVFVVDDEKVASLVAMDFEFEKVVQALSKHNNDLEQALNSLL